MLQVAGAVIHGTGTKNKCYHYGNIFVSLRVVYMRIIAVSTLKRYWERFPSAKQALLSWYDETDAAEWRSPNDLKAHYRSASVVTEKRVVFNIHGNKYRLIVDIEFRLKIVFVVWFGSHKQDDQIDVKKVKYVKTDKK